MKNRFVYTALILFSTTLLLMLVLRIIFWMYNQRFFPAADFTKKLELLYTGSRFDASTIAAALIPAMVLYLTYAFTLKTFWLKLMLLLVKLFLFLLITISLFDTGFYSFSFQRSSWETLRVAGDSLRVFKAAPLSYAGLFIAGILLIYLSNRLLNLFEKTMQLQTRMSLKSSVFVVIVFAVLIVCMRGLNARPLSPLSVSLYTDANYASIVTNTFQTVLYSITKPVKSNLYAEKKYYPADTVLKYMPFVHQFPAAEEKKYNVVIFVLESFSRAYLEKGNKYKVYTPFLDTLISSSFNCTNAFANGYMSVNGIQAILSGIPSIYDNTIDNSLYYQNFTRAMPAIFKERGYGTYFYYGANKDHFGLEKLTRRFGIDHYISEENYNHPQEHNGFWGINDSAFLQFMAGDLLQRKEPFFATVFNISSHYPYIIPAQYNGLFPKGNTAAARSVSFVDRSLQHFFEKVKTAAWYQNTIFVFVADHWNKEDDPGNVEGSGRYQIPLFIYKPDGSLKQIYTPVTDQISIFPTIMQLTGYHQKFTGFGTSMLHADTNRFTMAMKEWRSVMLSTNQQFELYYDCITDTLNKSQSLNPKSTRDNVMILEKQTKSFIQHYNHLFVNNKLADTSYLMK